jgi:sugar phosphate permease
MAKRSRFFYGWLILGWAVLVMALASGTRMSFGIAMRPLSEQFGWTRTMLSTIALMTGIIGGLLQMGMGLLVDRYGARRLLGSGVVLLGLGVWLLTVSTTVWQFGLAYGVLVGVGMAATQQVVTSALVANWFERNRGFAQSLLATAGAIGWMIVVPANMFIERTYDWTTMYRIMGTVLLVVVVPAILICIRNRPEDVGMQPYGADDATPTPGPTTTASAGIPLSQAVRTMQMWKLIYLGFA